MSGWFGQRARWGEGQMESGIKFGILGPLLIEIGGKEVPIAAARQRTLFAALLLRANTVVSLEALADAVWEEDPPSSYRVTLQGYVMRLRKTLGPEIGSRLHTRNPGYSLAVHEGEAELGEFESLVRRARSLAAAQDWSRASDEYRTALDLWRGDPLADLPALHHEHLHRLQEGRMQALEARIEADLHLGRHAELVAELTELTSAQPLRERPAEYLIRALHRTGRRGEALEAYQRTRRALIDELGIDPGPGLRAAHARILEQRPDPAAPAPAKPVRPVDPDYDPLAQAQTLVTTMPPGSGTGSGSATGARAGSAGSAGDAVAGRPGALAIGAVTGAAGAAASTGGGSGPGLGSSGLSAGSGYDSSVRLPLRPAPPPPVPAQLPADLPDFTGREHVLGRIDRRLGNSALAVPVLALTGPGGAGKSSLAIRAAHQARARFPDGQLYAHLAGNSGKPADPADILGRFLRALGVAADAVPVGGPERAAMWRTVLSTRRVLILVDDAKDSEQLIPLIPGAGGSVLMATARDRLTDLYGASFLQIDLFDRAESRALFDQIVDPGRTAREKSQVERVLEICADLPLAVRIAASRLASRPRWTVRDLADRLSDASRTLDELTGGAIAVRACFAVSHKQLAADADLAFRLMACAPGIELGLPAAASLLDLPVRSAEDLLELLVDVHLLESPRAGRYRYHDLVRAFAAEKAEELPAEDRTSAVTRLLTWQLITADTAVAVLLPNRPRTPGIGMPAPESAETGPGASAVSAAASADSESGAEPEEQDELTESADSLGVTAGTSSVSALLAGSGEWREPVDPSAGTGEWREPAPAGASGPSGPPVHAVSAGAAAAATPAALPASPSIWLPQPAGATTSFADPVTALRWLEAEQRALVGGVSLAAHVGRPDLSWRLAAVLEGYFVLRNLWGVWRDTQEVAIASAQASGDPAAQAALLGAHSDASRLLNLTESGLTMTFTSLSQLRNLGDSRSAAQMLTGLAEESLANGRYTEAADNARQAAAAWRDSADPDRRAEACNLAVYGRARLALGDIQPAVAALRRAVDALLAVDQGGLDSTRLDQTDLNALSSASMRTDEPLALALAALAQALDAEQW
ncbi:MAG TPA: BTAD domain-containing putative transcriptional regulator [Actinocrinis sp.]|nr:BTAD domain-containing putative transcriptional regulator [Actinocrinis sp.]